VSRDLIKHLKHNPFQAVVLETQAAVSNLSLCLSHVGEPVTLQSLYV